MTKIDFLDKVPESINHRAWGIAKIKVSTTQNDIKTACYRGSDNTSSCGTYGSTWLELYEKLSTHLIKEGYMTKS